MSKEMELSKSQTKIQPHDMIESFYIETREGYFFAIKGFEHPPDCLIAVLRYVPDREKGDRTKGRERYRRVYSFGEQETYQVWREELL